MGLSFHASGRVKRKEECRSPSRTINDRSPRPAAKTKEKPAGMNRRLREKASQPTRRFSADVLPRFSISS
jgi:hypothetical protein